MEPSVGALEKVVLNEAMEVLEFGTPLLQLPDVPQSVLVDPLQTVVVWPSSDPATPKNIAAVEKIRTAMLRGPREPFAKIDLEEADDERRAGLK